MNKSTVLNFTGDIGFDKYMAGRESDDDLIAPDVLSYLCDCDHLIVNVEGPLFDKSENHTGQTSPAKPEGMAATLIHAMDPKVAGFLAKIKADIWNICNNHIMDAGAPGIKSTLSIAKESGAATLGAGMNIDEASRPVIINEAGGIGMIGVGYQRACRKADDETPGCFSWSDLDLIRKRISEIKKTCRWCIVVAHAGEEFTAVPSPYTR
ncbi:MAG: CapA family protein, partial [Lachnospiraceae bacterium]|nr:CapA family protein [Lachnospiraceae bacterium]